MKMNNTNTLLRIMQTIIKTGNVLIVTKLIVIIHINQTVTGGMMNNKNTMYQHNNNIVSMMEHKSQ